MCHVGIAIPSECVSVQLCEQPQAAFKKKLLVPVCIYPEIGTKD